jgi:hypothetical protein
MCASLSTVAFLLAIHVAAHSVTFTFRSRPATVRAAYTAKRLAECGSGRKVALRGVHFVIHFMPAQSKTVVRRLPGAGAIRELAKVCDFESDIGWAIGLDKRRPYDVVRKGTRVTVVFR